MHRVVVCIGVPFTNIYHEITVDCRVLGTNTKSIIEESKPRNSKQINDHKMDKITNGTKIHS